MCNFIIKYPLLIIFAFNSNVFESISYNKLTGTKWKIHKTVEVIGMDTVIYKESMRTDQNGHHFVVTNRLGGFVNFKTDSTGLFCGFKGQWIQRDSVNVEIILAEKEIFGYQPYFFGKMEIRELTDSTVIIEKNVSRDGLWKREFHMTRW